MTHSLTKRLLLLLVAFLLPARGEAISGEVTSFAFSDPEETVIGEVVSLLYTGGETLAEIVRHYGVGHDEIGDANRGVDPDLPAVGEKITLPTSWILPEVMEEGILINLAELRLYFFEAEEEGQERRVTTFPIGIGRSGYDTPTGDYEVLFKLEDPTWYPTPSTRRRNRSLPQEVPPGPDNPLGRFWIHLSLEGYGIHGTNRPDSIGKRISLGCIRLLPEHIEWLFRRVHARTPVRIINRAVKMGRRGGVPYLEIHRNGLTADELLAEAWRAVEMAGMGDDAPLRVENAAREATGIPIPLAERNQEGE